MYIAPIKGELVRYFLSLLTGTFIYSILIYSLGYIITVYFGFAEQFWKQISWENIIYCIVITTVAFASLISISEVVLVPFFKIIKIPDPWLDILVFGTVIFNAAIYFILYQSPYGLETNLQTVCVASVLGMIAGYTRYIIYTNLFVGTKS